MAFGDHIAVTRLGYAHHGIDVGDGEVVHFSGEPGRGKSAATITRSPIDAFLAGGQLRVIAYGRCDDPEQVVERALSRLGESGYRIFDNNCEHFARWCKTGRRSSEQVRRAVHGTAAPVVTGAAAQLGVVGVTTLGVAGVSGAGVMSGLATAGAVIGGGAAAGPAVLGVVPAAAGVLIVNSALADDESQPDGERTARRDGRVASTAGAVGALAAAPVAVSVAGTAGLSAAGISSGLAAIGAVAGGGMVAGTAILVAAPVAAATALGFGVYGVSRLFRS